MKHIILKSAALAFLTLGTMSCADDLNISPIDPQTSPTYDVKQLLAKQYASLGLTGQKGPDGNGDMSGDEGESGFYRTVFNLNELNTDEILWAWQDNEDIAPITNMAWTSASPRVNWCYQRLAYDVTLHNQFISEQTGKLPDDEIAEIRFLRALNYFEFLDLFHRAPFKLEFNGEFPVEKVGVDLYNWIDQELTAIEPMMKEVGAYCNSKDFGRADRGAAYALHARLALNAMVYTDGQVNDYQKAKDYCDKIISANVYELAKEPKNGYTGYQQLFMADNDENPEAMKEIILPIRQDGAKARSHGGSTMLINGTRCSGMPYYYQSNPWQCILARKDMVGKFIPGLDVVNADNDACSKSYDKYLKDNNLDASKLTEADILKMDEALGASTKEMLRKAGDDRALLYGGFAGGVRRLSPDKTIKSFFDGLSIVKWSNVRTDGAAAHGDNFCDTDIPLFRLGEIYLTRAEALYRLGDKTGALKDIQKLQERAHRINIAQSVDLNYILDEWCREFYLEGRRRSDLVRFGLFTSSQYVWSFKGGQENGVGVDSHYNVYPVPANEIAGNANLHQNPGY